MLNSIQSNRIFDTSLTATNTLDAFLCPLRGFKCKDHQCNCSDMCQQGYLYEKITILEGDDVVMLDEYMQPGTYCVPKGISECNRKSSILIFSTNGWMCRNKPLWRGNYMVACKSSKAKNNLLNVLIDKRTGSSVEHESIYDYYETLPDGSRRYECLCGSLDVNGNRMMEIIPFLCSSDYCTKDLKELAKNLTVGWKDGKCECGIFPHKDPNDPTSPCMYQISRIVNNKVFVGRVDCMTENSMKEFPIYCPNNVNTLNFQKKIGMTNDPHNYISIHGGESEKMEL